ncbi:hypothetical protein BON30_20450 [Cystobacter ferrugineus]|uniref:Uncharacterized protein n=1 Tax=Cystobacter ferrugineus TaxID=83449 RepID=A0A1L9B8P1_9BACT|nr:hypothetical protein BON30_20450 [Cystobacter ferrugineus]
MCQTRLVSARAVPKPTLLAGVHTAAAPGRPAGTRGVAHDVSSTPPASSAHRLQDDLPLDDMCTPFELDPGKGGTNGVERKPSRALWRPDCQR